ARETTSGVSLQAAPAGWREARLDLLLAEELAVNPDFAERFARAALEKAGHSPPPGAPAVVHVRFNVWHEIDDGNHGENDLDATLTWRDGTTRRLLIEDKVWAPLQPRQAERYLARAQDCGAAAVIVAPQRWLDGHPEAVKHFHGSHAIEEIAKWLRDTARRLTWRADVLDELATPRVTGAALDHQPTIDFRDFCIDWLTAHNSPAVAWPLSLHTENQGWLCFQHPRDLAFKASTGVVDLYVEPNGFRGTADELVALGEFPLPGGFHVATDSSKKRNVVLRRPVKTINAALGVPAEKAPLEEALDACRRIVAWFDGGGADLLARGV
ncbi:MAG: hypothetical protein M3256_23970, partial [Actinomycetota bacterium]|nr:hypothetical protein [Actinomycetota bacterium]